MKKIIMLLLTAAMLLGLAGCGHKESSEDRLKEAIKDFNKEVFNNSEDAEDSEVDEKAEADEDGDDSKEKNKSEGIFGFDGDDDADTTEDEDSEEEAELNPDDESANQAADPVRGDYMVFDSSEQVLNTFRELGYEYINKNPGEEQTSWSFEYKYLGSETIDGVSTEHYQMTMVEDGETTVSEAWYDNTWTAVKYLDSSGEQTGINAGFAGSNLTMMTQLYCTQIVLNISAYSTEGVLDELAYEQKDTGSKNMDFGFGNTEVELQDIKYLYGGIVMHNGAAKLNGKKFYVILETETEDGTLAGMHITKAIPR
jgi:hypothetical protein